MWSIRYIDTEYSQLYVALKLHYFEKTGHFLCGAETTLYVFNYHTLIPAQREAVLLTCNS